MKVLVTGAKGFIGKNLCLFLKNRGHIVFEYDLGSTDDELVEYIKQCDFIVHLAGINRPLTPEEFIDGNVNFTKKLLDLVNTNNSKAPVIFTSSTQATLDNPYGKSKKAAEDQLFEFAKEGHQVYVYRLYNAFGKWCRPNYNSVIATFCYNVAHDIPLQINEAAPAIDFVYIDDICAEFTRIIETKPESTNQIMYVEPHYSVTLHDVANLLYSFRSSRSDLQTPLQEGFSKKLYATYLSYLEPADFAYELTNHVDQRGSFTEVLKTMQYGQMSVNVSKPGITKGNHYHMTKNEKYLVVSGKCEIKLRQVFSEKVISYVCDDKHLRVVDIPTGYTHSITNIGKKDSVTLMWASELYDPNNPDTVYCPVEQDEENKK
jgi:UDP-2-acetamido-2,6-beta-L-arabino-hexul-4-ose reductase